MDIVRIIRRLAAVGGMVVVGVAGATTVENPTPPQTFDSAKSHCTAYQSAHPATDAFGDVLRWSACVATTDPEINGKPPAIESHWERYSSGTGSWSAYGNSFYWLFDGNIPSPLPACNVAPFDIPSGNTDPAALRIAATTCSVTQPNPDTGNDLGCQITSTPSGPYIQDAAGMWHGHMHVTESGAMCKVSSDGTWKGTLGDGTPEGTSTAVQSPPAPTTGPEPRICKGDTCYDPNTGNLSTVVNGQTKYLPNVPNMIAGTAPGTCASDASSSLCGGAPPPLPPNPPISDPPSQTLGVDQYATVTNEGTGKTITVVVYGGPGTTSVSSGQQTGDQGPASSGSSGGSNSSVIGGGDCKTPPACRGDAVQCAVVAQTYAGRCASEAVQKAVQSTQDPPASGKHTVSEVDGGAIDLGDTSSLDSSGFGFGTACPFVPVEISIGPQMASIPMDKICEFGPWMRGFILMLAAMKCADILGKK